MKALHVVILIKNSFDSLLFVDNRVIITYLKPGDSAYQKNRLLLLYDILLLRFF